MEELMEIMTSLGPGESVKFSMDHKTNELVAEIDIKGYLETRTICPAIQDVESPGYTTTLTRWVGYSIERIRNLQRKEESND